MIERFFSELCSADIHRDWLRNIVSLRESQQLFDDLSDDAEDWRTAVAAEMAAKPADFGDTPIINRPFEQARYCAAIRYPFENWASSRYSDGNFGVWYGADSIETSVFETAHHWLRFLRDANFGQGEKTIIGERRIFNVQCDGLLFDLHPMVANYSKLVEKNQYTFTQQIGQRLHREGHPGLITRSAHCEGDISAIFTPRVLSNPRDHCYLDYRLESDTITITRQPDVPMMDIRVEDISPVR